MKLMKTVILTLIFIPVLLNGARQGYAGQAKTVENQAIALINKSFTVSSTDELQREYKGRKKTINSFITKLKKLRYPSAAERVGQAFRTTFKQNYKRKLTTLQKAVTTRVVPPPPPPQAYVQKEIPMAPPPAPTKVPKAPRVPLAPPIAAGRPPAGPPVTVPVTSGRAKLLEEIRAGRQLKKVEITPEAVTEEELLAQIRAGAKLKPLSERELPTKKQPSELTAEEQIEQALAKRRQFIETKEAEEEEDNEEWKD